MKRNIVKFIMYALLLCLLVFLFTVFWPRTYDVPSFEKRAGTKYWALSTGSTIGYTFVPAKGTKKPYPVIYLHGGPGGFVSETVIEVLARLSGNGYDVYFYDQVGSGQSGRLENIGEYTVERHLRDLKEIINKTGAEKAILIGQSWGAVLAVLFSAGNPAKVYKLVLTSPGPLYPIRKELANIKSPDSLQLKEPPFSNRQGNKKENNIRTRAMAFLATCFHIKLAPEKEADYFATYLKSALDKSTVCDTAKLVKPKAGDGFYAGILSFNSLRQLADSRAAIKNLTIPVLVIKGQCDNQPWGFTNEYLQLFADHQLAIIPNAGHSLYLEQPELYVRTIQQFLK